MFINRFFYLLIVAVLVLTACAPQVIASPAVSTSAPAATQIHVEPITLRLAVSDAQGRPSEPYVLLFMEQVKILSNGSISIEPTWDAGAEITPFFEQGVVKVVKEGQYELGLAGSRAWDGMGVTSFQALQAPFLIDNDALSEAVASSNIATQMLDGLSSVDMTGLALWPEDLRHPFSMTPDKPILSPEDLKGLTVRSIPSEISYMLIDTLGGSPMYGDSYQAAESGLRQGASLSGTPTATGNVIFFPKFQVLFANGAALEKLSEAQRSILREAAAATQKKAIAEHPTEADAAAAWCADGGAVVMASAEQIAAFEAAAQPVFDKIEQEPLNSELIAAIRQLKAKTTPSPGAVACAPVSGNVSPDSNAETQAWSEGLPSNGVWRVELTTDDFVRMGVLRSVAQDWAGVYTITLEDGKYLNAWQGEQGQSGKCQANYELVGDIVRLTYYQTTGDECVDEVDDIQWRLDNDGLHIHLVDIKNAPLTEIKAYYEAKTWQKVETWSEGLPPNGTWTVSLTVEEIVGQGVMRSKATDWVGMYTWTFQDGKAQFDYKDMAGAGFSCQADVATVENVVKVTYSSGSDCENEVDDIQWRLHEDGLHLHLVAIKNAPFLENKAYLEAKPWQKVE